MAAIYTLENPVFRAYAFYSAVVLLKMGVIQFWTVKARFQNKAFSNPEDGKGPKDFKTDENVERVRRAHLNDIENIPVFVLLGLAYVACNPSLQVALWHFRIFAVARVLHSVFYLNAVQPFRGLSFLAGLVSSISVGVQVLLATM